MQRTARASDKGGVGTTRERHRLLLGLALLLAVFADVTPRGQFGAVSTTITSSNDPSALQQLATFAALAEVAEEEDLDWGSLTRLDRARRAGNRPNDAASSAAGRKDGVSRTPMRVDPTSTVGSSSSSAAGATTSDSEDDTDSGGGSTGAVPTSQSEDGTGGSSVLSRRRPHRRQHRKKGGHASVAASQSISPTPPDSGYAASSSSLAASVVLGVRGGEGGSGSGSVHNHKIWSQLHVMEVAYSTRSNNFIDVAARFAEYEQMYPIVYQCALGHVACPAEAELLATPTTGLAASRRWSCPRCGYRHEAVRESCQRCRAPSHFAKLFVGQTVKEVSCAPSLIRLLHATHPHIPLHRVECHSDQHGRSKGCASLYVDRANAAELMAKLDRNVFFDVDDATGDLIAHYVYTQQREWLAALAAERGRGEGRALHLPWKPLVVEESKQPGPSAGDRHQPPHDQRTAHPPYRSNGNSHQQPQIPMLFAL